MLRKLRKSRRGISEVLAVVIILGLVLGASALVGIVLLNVDDIAFPGSVQATEPKTVQLSAEIIDMEDTDLDGFYDTVTLNLTLYVGSPSIYIHDIDMVLPTGQTLDEVAPWVTFSNQFWNEGYNGYAMTPSTNESDIASFITKTSDMDQDESELVVGSSIYIVINYFYVQSIGSRESLITDFYQSPLILIT